jgi:hypothetical protein
VGIDDKADAQALLAELEHPCKGDRYRSYHGGAYAVIAVGIKEDTLEPLVAVEDEHHPERGVQFFALRDFVESVSLADGSTRPRFLLIG